MCGIFGACIYGTKLEVEALIDLLLNGLRRLEYRGYDSTGFSFGSNPIVIKAKGNVSNLTSLGVKIEYEMPECNHVCIAHTRWATHGAPSDINAHPHSSGHDNQFVVVHNGIIRNYSALRALLEAKGYTFASHTDTEVIPILCKMYYDQGVRNFLDIVTQAISHLEGTYAILVKSKHYPDDLVACRKESPLIIGRGTTKPGHYFLASDVAAIVEHTDKVCYLEDGDVAYISPLGVYITNTGALVTRPYVDTHLPKDAALKSGYPHYMLKEIMEQPSSLANTLANRCGEAFYFPELSRHTERIRKAPRILMIACGTSLNACYATRGAFESLLRLPVACENACDFVERHGFVSPDDVCIFVSQSGETADTLAALRYAAARYAFCIGITNTYASTLARETNTCIYINAGPEVGVGSTKAYTAQVALLVGIASSLAHAHALAPTLQSLPSILDTFLITIAQTIKSLSSTLKDEKHIMFIGRGANYATALEASLKLKEISYIHAEAVMSGELKHGPLALIDDSILCIVIATRDALYEKSKSTVKQLQARGARIILLTNDPNDFPGIKALVVPHTIDTLQGIINIIPFQLLSYYTAIEKGINVDQPRNLAKSVTVSD